MRGVDGHALGITHRGVGTWAAAVAATHHLLLSHGEAVRALRAALPRGQVGIDLNLQAVRPASDHEEDRAAARRTDGNSNRLFLDPLLLGSLSLRHARALRRPAARIRRGPATATSG